MVRGLVGRASCDSQLHTKKYGCVGFFRTAGDGRTCSLHKAKPHHNILISKRSQRCGFFVIVVDAGAEYLKEIVTLNKLSAKSRFILAVHT